MSPLSKSTDDKVKKAVSKLREVEMIVRNKATHQMISLVDKKIKSETGLSSAEIMNLIKTAFNYMGFNIKNDDWNSYDDMNSG